MSLCTITGLLKDSGDNLLSGELWVQLDQPIVDIDTTPDSTILPRLFKFAIAAGSINISLRESETHRTTYQFRFFASSGSPAVLDSDPSIDFHAFVPALTACDFADLLPTSITADLRDTAIARLARLLTTNQQFAAALRGGPRYLGVYSPTTYYQLDDCVSYGGSSWIWISPLPGVGSTPSTLNTNWIQSGAKGEAGGTGGQDTAFDPVGWDGAMWAPTANVLRDRFILLATLLSPALTGTPTTPTAATGTNTTQIASCAFAIAEIAARLNNTALAGNPTAPTQPTTQNDTRLATTAFVKNNYRYSRIIDTKAAFVQGGASIAGIQTRTLNTVVTNSGDVVTLSGNTFTLRPGTYYISASAPALGTNHHRIFLWNVGTAARVATGKGAFTLSSDTVQTRSALEGTFTIAANTDFQIRHYTSFAVASYGLGAAIEEAGISEIYTEVELWRID